MPLRRSSTSAVRALADEELMQLVRRGEARAFEVLYDRHSGAAFSLAYRMVGTRSTAEEVVQEAFLAFWRVNARYDRTRGSVRTWILGIVHNRAIDALRRSMVHDRRRASDEGLEERFEARERTDLEVARRDELARILDGVQQLPDDRREALIMRFALGMDNREIARALGRTDGATKVLIHRAIRQLQEIVGT